MVVTEYRGHTLSNAVSAIVIYYPKVSGGHDLIKDTKENPESLSVMGYLYAAFRMAGDSSIRNTPVSDIVSEIEYQDLITADSEFYKTINKLMNEGKGSSKNV